MPPSIPDQSVSDESLAAVSFCLPYRKDRNYLHSADIFRALTEFARGRFGAEAYVDSLVLRRQAVRQICVSSGAKAEMIGTFSVRAQGERVRSWLVETDAEVRIRVPYDESPAAGAVIGGPGLAWFAEPVMGYTAFEQLLVLLKTASGQGQRDAWLCQLDLRAPLLETRPLAVKLRHRGMQRFFAFEIMQDEQVIGTANASLRS